MWTWFNPFDKATKLKIKGLVESLKISRETTKNGELLCFLLGFRPLLDTLERDFKKKREIIVDVDKHNLLQQKELSQGESMRTKAFSLDIRAQMDKFELESLEVSIPLWEDEIIRLQEKFDTGKKRQAEINGSSLVLITAQHKKSRSRSSGFGKSCRNRDFYCHWLATRDLVDSMLQQF